MKIGDKEFVLTPVGFDLQLAAQRHLEQLREVEFQRALRLCADSPPAVQQRVIDEALTRLNQMVTLSAVLLWIDSPAGQAFQLWYVLSRHHTDLSLETVESMMANVTSQHMREIELIVRRQLGLEVPDGG